LISPEKPGEFDGLPVEMITLIRRVRCEKVEMHQLERERIQLAGVARQAVLDQIEIRMAELDASRKVLLGRIAKLMPGYNNALRWAQANMGFDEAIGTVRFNKRRDGCITFGMPGQPVMAVWVEGGEVVRSETIDW
jgi:hypothetical protein